MGWQPAEIPTARFTAMVKTFITMPMIACGSFASYLLCAPYFASMFMETIVMAEPIALPILSDSRFPMHSDR